MSGLDQRETDERFQNVMEQIQSEKTRLLQIKNLSELQPATDEADEELYKIGYNLKILAKLIYICGEEVTHLSAHLNKKTLEKADELVGDILQEMGLVKSNKFKYIKMLLYREEEQVEQMRNKYKYFLDMYETYTEWIHILKKTRTVA